MTSSRQSQARRGAHPSHRPRLKFEALEDRRLLSAVPDGPEFRVNTYTTNSQQAASIATDAAGNFVVAWHSIFQDGNLQPPTATTPPPAVP
jgi:hypothetical protein